jgi:hypothetical protein
MCSDKEMHVRAQGARPENLLFLIHEVFESLISDAFNGISFDYLVPCPNCTLQVFQVLCLFYFALSQLSFVFKLCHLFVICLQHLKESHMFSARVVRRARELKAPFLQCTVHFHVITLPDLLGTS